MAIRLTSSQRAAVYKQLNRYFDLVLQQLDDLAQARILNARKIREMSGLTQEVQLEINTLLLGPLDALEHEDWGTFGKVRIAMEKRLRDPNDVFIHAEQRRKELAKQGRKSRRK